MNGHRKPRQRRELADPMTVAMNHATRLTKREVEAILTPVEAGFRSLREGVATEDEWVYVVSAMNISDAIELQGVVRGVRKHIQSAQLALCEIRRRAMSTGDWRATALYHQELDDIRVAVDIQCLPAQAARLWRVPPSPRPRNRRGAKHRRCRHQHQHRQRAACIRRTLIMNPNEQHDPAFFVWWGLHKKAYRGRPIEDCLALAFRAGRNAQASMVAAPAAPIAAVPAGGYANAYLQKMKNVIGGDLNVSGQRGLRHLETGPDHPLGAGLHIASGKSEEMLVAICEVVNASLAAGVPGVVQPPADAVSGPMTEAPEIGAVFWTPTAFDSIGKFEWRGSGLNLDWFRRGECFRTEADARAAMPPSQPASDANEGAP